MRERLRRRINGLSRTARNHIEDALIGLAIIVAILILVGGITLIVRSVESRKGHAIAAAQACLDRGGFPYLYESQTYCLRTPEGGR